MSNYAAAAGSRIQNSGAVAEFPKACPGHHQANKTTISTILRRRRLRRLGVGVVVVAVVVVVVLVALVAVVVVVVVVRVVAFGRRSRS